MLQHERSVIELDCPIVFVRDNCKEQFIGCSLGRFAPFGARAVLGSNAQKRDQTV